MGAATFNPALSTERDEARLRLGDTDTEHALRDDATYDALISKYGLEGAVTLLAQGLVAEYGQYPTRTDENGVTLDFTERLTAWRFIVSQAGRAPAPLVFLAETAPGAGASVSLVTRARW